MLSGIPIPLRKTFQFLVISIVKGFSVVSEAEVDFFLVFPGFPSDPANVCNFISGSSVLSKHISYIWKFLLHVLLQPSLNNFERKLASLWNEHNCTVFWTFFGIALLWDWSESWHFPVLCHCWIFQMCWHTEFSTLTTSSFGILNSSAGVPSPPLSLFVVILPKAHLTSH